MSQFDQSPVVAIAQSKSESRAKHHRIVRRTIWEAIKAALFGNFAMIGLHHSISLTTCYRDAVSQRAAPIVIFSKRAPSIGRCRAQQAGRDRFKHQLLLLKLAALRLAQKQHRVAVFLHDSNVGFYQKIETVKKRVETG